MALVALETKLAQRYTAEKAAHVVDKWNRGLYRLPSDAVEVVTIVPTRMQLNEGGLDE
jgi:hypothetical protein